MKLPNVEECTVVNCAYNKDNLCHAAAITVGGDIPCCDTFTNDRGKGGIPEIGSVGACKVVNCEYNDSLECSAGSIVVGSLECKADCLTFEPVSKTLQ